MSEITRVKMCKRKMSFYTAKAAQRIADRNGHRVYECPICFTFHITSKPPFDPLFIAIEEHQRIVSDLNKRLESNKIKMRNQANQLAMYQTVFQKQNKGTNQ